MAKESNTSYSWRCILANVNLPHWERLVDCLGWLRECGRECGHSCAYFGCSEMGCIFESVIHDVLAVHLLSADQFGHIFPCTRSGWDAYANGSCYYLSAHSNLHLGLVWISWFQLHLFSETMKWKQNETKVLRGIATISKWKYNN